MQKPKHVDPSDLPTKRVHAPDGSVIQMKVVQTNSATFAQNMLAAFRSNVRRIKTEQRKRVRAEQDAAQTGQSDILDRCWSERQRQEFAVQPHSWHLL